MKNKNGNTRGRLSVGARGFTLLIAAIFMSVMLSFGLALASLSYKQQVLSSSAVQSQYAFYAADAGLECTLYANQKQNLFAYPASDPGETPPGFLCDNAGPVSSSEAWTTTRWVVAARFSLDAGKRCVDVTVYKPKGGSGQRTYIFSLGYDVPCSVVANPQGARFVLRGLSAVY